MTKAIIDFTTCNIEDMYKNKDAAEVGKAVTEAVIDEIKTVQDNLDAVKQAAKNSVEQAIEVGKLLNSLKDDDTMVHGAWTPYVERFITKPTGIPYKTLSTWMKFANNEDLLRKSADGMGSFAKANKAIIAAKGSKRTPRKVSHDERIQKAATALMNALDEAAGADLSAATLAMLNELEANVGKVLK
jgi:hypothetical protein